MQARRFASAQLLGVAPSLLLGNRSHARTGAMRELAIIRALLASNQSPRTTFFPYAPPQRAVCDRQLDTPTYSAFSCQFFCASFGLKGPCFTVLLYCFTALLLSASCDSSPPPSVPYTIYYISLPPTPPPPPPPPTSRSCVS
jgi:hypothetical protein